MKRALSLLLFSLIFSSGAATAQLTGGGAPPQIPTEPLVTLHGIVTSANGDELHGIVTATILDGWHINSNKPLTEFSIPTALTFDETTATLVRADYPAHELRSFAFSPDKLAVFEKTIRIPFVAKAKPGVRALKASLHFQACNDKVCLRPDDATTEIATTVVADAGATTAPSPAAAPSAGANFTPLSAAPKDGRTTPPSSVMATFAEHGLPLTLLVLFVGGLALNLTPCVLPMLPITLGFFAMQSDGRRSRRFLLSLAYVLGIVVMYASLGVVAALSGKLFGAWLQNPLVLIGLAVLMLVLASSMFGAWEMRVPQFIANRSHGRSGFVGAALMGLFVGIVAAPCVGPVVAALFILVASIGKPLIGFAMFGALGFGLGFPYLAALSVLPKPGEWMVVVKKALGFVLVAEAFYFVRPLVHDTIYRGGVAVSLLVGAAFLFFVKAQGARTLRLILATLLLVSGVFFAIPQRHAAGASWDAYQAARLTAESGKPVVIDFYADWCLPCKELDEKTFTDPRVIAELGRFTRLKANLTSDRDPKTRALTRQYAIVGVPTLVFIGSDGKEIPGARLTGFEGPDKFLERLKSVR
jgi:thiol:disulfide interchange protein DsbD